MNHGAVILVGGQSTRMGRDKALIEVGEQPLLARQIDLAWATRATEVFISGRPGVDYSHFNCPVLLDRLPGVGPLAGIERGLAALTNVRLLVLAVDLPEMTETLLTAMAEASPEHLGAIPRLCGRIEPLAAFSLKHLCPWRRLHFGATTTPLRHSRNNVCTPGLPSLLSCLHTKPNVLRTGIPP